MSNNGDGLLGLDGAIRLKQKLERLESWRDPLRGEFLVRALPGNTAGLPVGSVHHLAGINWKARMVELVDPMTQEPPVYTANFTDVETVGRQMIRATN